MPSLRSACTVLLSLASLGCDASAPVSWDASRSVQSASSAVHLSADGDVTTDKLAAMSPRIVVPGAACRGSVRLGSSGNKLFAVWWAPRRDSTATLNLSVSADSGRTWSSVALVDTTDHGSMGCNRAPPAVAADEANGYVHVTYGMQGAEGPGLFYAHSMDHGATFHSPVPILYGERLGPTSVASSGDLVAVAFEDPGSRTPRIGLALSGTMGHIFENRVMPISDDNSAATEPLVAVNGHRITVAWREGAASNGSAVLRLRSGSIP